MLLTVLIVCVLVLGVFFIIQLVSLFAMIFSKPLVKHHFEEWPMVTIILAVRNESLTVERCLNAFFNLNYPSEKLQVLIGNDKSEDDTEAKVLNLIKDKPNFKLIPINGNMGKALGKANVIAHLAHHAQGEFYFITDSDVAVPREWIKSLLACFKPQVGIASGTTTCQSGGFSADLQAIDWLHFMGYIKAFANLGVSCTSVGNNMAVRAKAYWETGGYEHIDFSITEDYKLFKEVTSRGWQWRNILNSQSLGLATHISSLSEILHQRKRWLMGANDLPWNWKCLLIIYGLFVPCLLIISYYNPLLGLGLWLLKMMIQYLFISILNQKAQARLNVLRIFLLYEIYVILMTVFTAVFYLLPVKSVWKGRKYQSSGLFEAQ